MIEKLYRQRLEELGRQTVEPMSQNVVTLPPLVPRRLRDPEHLRFIASIPCIVCGRAPSQAHHLLFAQPRAMGRKVSDEWTVPLCLLHHRALHDVGDEERWWGDQQIDAKREAEGFWQQSHDPVQGALGALVDGSEHDEDPLSSPVPESAAASVNINGVGSDEAGGPCPARIKLNRGRRRR